MHGSNGASAGQDAQDATEPLVKIDDIDFETISKQQQKEQLEVVEMEVRSAGIFNVSQATGD